MLHLNWLEWFGYAASVVVAVSLMMSSIVKLRWYNLVGATAFSVYGFLIRAYPVGALNGFIALVDVYYLVQIYATRERLQLVRVPADSEYLRCFLDEYRTELTGLFPRFDFQVSPGQVGFYVLRNLVPACLFLGTPRGDGILEVDVDFVVPAYRDFKPGVFLFRENRDLFRRMGFRRIVARSTEPRHDVYLRRIGFRPGEGQDSDRRFTLDLNHGTAERSS